MARLLASSSCFVMTNCDAVAKVHPSNPHSASSNGSSLSRLLLLWHCARVSHTGHDFFSFLRDKWHLAHLECRPDSSSQRKIGASSMTFGQAVHFMHEGSKHGQSFASLICFFFIWSQKLLVLATTGSYLDINFLCPFYVFMRAV